MVTHRQKVRVTCSAPLNVQRAVRRDPMPQLTRSERSILVYAIYALTVSATSALAAGPTVVHNARHDTSLPLAQLANRGRMPSNRTDREMAEPRPTRGALASGREDAVAKPLAAPLSGV